MFPILLTWRSKSSSANAVAFNSLFEKELRSEIGKRGAPGCGGFYFYNRELNNEVEFILTGYFETLEGAKNFAGNNFKNIVITENGVNLLSYYDESFQCFRLLD